MPTKQSCHSTWHLLKYIGFNHLILSFSSAAMTIGEKGNSNVALVPVSNLVSQLAI